MRVVLDTNVLVASLSSRSEFHELIEALIDEQFEMIVSNEVLLEYEEILKKKYPFPVAENFIRALHELPNVHQKEIHYQWKLITTDPDDDKFVDLAVSANVDFIVTNDKHFNAVKDIPFPKVTIISLQQFLPLLKSDC